MANKKTLDESLEIRKSLLEQFTRYGIPVTVLLCVGLISFLIIYYIGFIAGFAFAAIIFTTLFAIHKKDPKAMMVILQVLQHGEINLSPFVQDPRKTAVKNSDGVFSFLK